MKKYILAIIGIAAIVTTITFPKMMQAATQNTDSVEMFQTWEEFSESEVQIEYDETFTSLEDAKN